MIAEAGCGRGRHRRGQRHELGVQAPGHGGAAGRQEALEAPLTGDGVLAPHAGDEVPVPLEGALRGELTRHVVGQLVEAAAVRAGRIAGAAIDVYDPEPPGPDFPLLGLESVLLTPHMAARTHTAVEGMSWVVRDVVEVLSGRPPKYPAP